MRSAATPRGQSFSLDEYLALPDEDDRIDLVRGRLVREPPPAYEHGLIQNRIAFLLQSAIRRQRLALDCLGPNGFVLERGPDTVRAPDVALVARGRELLSNGYIDGAPLLAVEIVSPSNTAADLDEKVQQYLAAGAHRVWVVYPKTQHVVVHRGDGSVEVASGTMQLDAGEVAAGLDICAKSVFEDDGV